MLWARPYPGCRSSHSRMIPSRATFATMEAAAMETERASPFTIAGWGTGRPSTSRPSTNRRSGFGTSPRTARRMARWVACRIFNRSISSTSARPRAHAFAPFRMRASWASRCFRVRRFESSRPPGSNPSPRMTAPANTGPQRAPRPTSSTPATSAWPPCRASSSNRVPQRSSTPRGIRGRRPRSEAPLIAAFAPPRAARGLDVAHRVQALLLHAAGLALAVAQVVELGPAHLGLLDHLDLLDRLRVHGKDALDALAKGHLAHGHGGPRPATAKPDHHAFEDLQPLALGLLLLALLALGLFLDLALLDPHVHAHGVARAEAGQALLEVRRLDVVDGIHFSLVLFV